MKRCCISLFISKFTKQKLA